MIEAIMVAAAYLFGSFPTALLVTRALTGTDIRTRGSGNPGASNVARTAGIKVGAVVAVVDILKGAIPVWLAWGVGMNHLGLALTALAAVLGHDFSVFLGGKGGKGVATTFGVALALMPWAALIAIVAWAGIMLVVRYSSVASLVALVVLPPLFWLTGASPPFVWCAVALLVLGLGKHYPNIQRLLQGNERRFARVRLVGGR